MKKKIIASILLLVIVIFTITTINTSTIRDALRNLLPSNTKAYVKELFLENNFLEEVKFLELLILIKKYFRKRSFKN